MPTTASEWLADEDAPLPDAFVVGGVTYRLATEMPDWLRAEIATQLRTAFAQDYWSRINATTQADIQTILQRGFDEGLSTQQVARNIRRATESGFEYYKRRAENIARTEAGNALNGGRRAGIDGLRDLLAGDGIKVIVTWISALAQLTRDAHAFLNRKPADDDGLWDLNGVRVPYPAHYSLPAKDRCNCLCTVVSEFDIED